MAIVNSNAIIYVLVKSHSLLVIPDSTSSKVFSRWLGPANVIEQKSHSYIVEYNGVSRHFTCRQTS